MRSDTNGVAEYSGKEEYWIHQFGYGNELLLYQTEIWQQLSGTNSQLKDGLFYQLDSSRSYQQDTIEYHHHKLRFGADILDYHYLTNGTREMPDENANWNLKCYGHKLTDSTFLCGYQVYYQFLDGKMVSHGRRGDHDQRRSYVSYSTYRNT